MNLAIAAVPFMHIDVSMIVLRLIHILAGTLWAGIVWYVAFIILPDVRSVSAGDLRWMAAIPIRIFGYLNIAAATAIISGAFMYWEVSGGLSRQWLTTPRGAALTGASILGVLAAIDGVVLTRPLRERMTAARQGTTARAADSASGTDGSLAEMLQSAVYRLALLVALVLAGMAVARYL